jgi:hypothetical protein
MPIEVMERWLAPNLNYEREALTSAASGTAKPA